MEVGENIATFRRTFQEVTKEEKLAFTWQWDGDNNESLVSISFKEEDKSTRVTLTHTGLSNDEDREKHTMGWTGSLMELTGFLS